MILLNTLSVDLYKPSSNEEILYCIDKTYANSIKTLYYDKITKYRVYLNMYNELESGIEYRSYNKDLNNDMTIWIKKGRMILEDDFYFRTFDLIEAEEKLLEYKKEMINNKKIKEEEEIRALYEEIKSKYSDKEWFK